LLWRNVIPAIGCTIIYKHKGQGEKRRNLLVANVLEVLLILDSVEPLEIINAYI